MNDIFFLKLILAIGVFKIRCWRVNYIKIISYGSVPSIFMVIFIRLSVSATSWIRLKGRSQSLMSSFGHRRALEIHSCRSPASNSEFGQLNSKLYSRWIIEGLGSESEKNIHFWIWKHTNFYSVTLWTKHLICHDFVTCFMNSFIHRSTK